MVLLAAVAAMMVAAHAGALGPLQCADLSLLIFTLETYRFCMKCIEFPTRTYNFKNLYEEMLRSDENRSLFSS